MHLLRTLKISGDMGHELFNNLREGNWLLDYIIERQSTFMQSGMQNVLDFLKENFGLVKGLNASLRPRYAMRVIEKLYNAAVNAVLRERMTDPFIRENEDIFVQNMAVSSLQMWGRVPSAYFGDF